MLKLHFNYKDVFRALRLGFSAKKVWMAFLGLACGLAGYSILTYLAHAAAGADFATVWAEYRLLPFADPFLYPFPWYSWIIYALGILFFVCAMLLTGAAVSKVAYEQLRGDEFFESREAFGFAFRQWSSVLASPLLLIGFAAVVVGLGVIASLIAGIPWLGEIWIGLVALPGFFASLFVVYLLVVLLTSFLIGPSIVGATRDDTFDTVFEVFSCLNEQPARLALYVPTVAALAKLGSALLAVAATAAGTICYWVLRILPGDRLDDVLSNAAYYFNVTLPDWWPEPVRALFHGFADWLGLSEAYILGDYVSISWTSDIGSALVALVLYIVALMVIAFGCSVWYSGNTLVFAVLAKKKDDRNILELPDEDELLAPVVDVPGHKPGDEQPVADKRTSEEAVS